MKESLRHFFIPCAENGYRPTSLSHRAFMLYVAVALVLKFGVISILTFLPRTLFFADVTSSALVALTNEARTVNGLPALREDATLAKAAREKANDLVTKGYFAHESPDGRTPWYWFRLAGYRYLYAGENLAKDFLDSSAIVQAWLASPGHRANVLNTNYRDIAIAVATGPTDATGKKSVVVVQLFGQTASASPKPAQTLSPSPSPTPAPSPIPAPSQELVPTPQPLATFEPVPTAPVVAAASPATIPDTDATAVASRVAGEAVQEERISMSRGRFIFTARLMTFTERAVEGFYMLFLAVLMAATLLNILIHPRIQHGDLILRSAFLIVFFFSLILFEGRAFLDYRPQVL